MEDLVERITRGNVTEVKVVLATVAAAVAVYQVTLAAVIYGRLRVPVLSSPVASIAHRSIGDALVVVIALVALMCVSVYGFETEEGALHVIAGTLLLVFLAVKIAVLKWWHGLNSLLPGLGITVFILLLVTWFSSAGDFLGVG